MAQYRIKSDRLTIGNQGETISEDKLEGLNVEALIAGEHLEVVTSTKKNTEPVEEK